MRHLLSVAFLSASIAVLPSAFAQRTGHAGGFSGGHTGGAMGRMPGGFAGGSFGRSPGVAPHGFNTAPNFVSTAPANAVSTAPNHAFAPGYASGYHLPVAATPAWRGEGRGDRDRDRNIHYRSPYRGFGAYPYAYANSWQLLAWDLGYADSTGYSDYDSGPVMQQPYAASVPAPDDGYRQDYNGPAEPGYESGYGDPQPSAPKPYTQNSVASEPELTLIFSDGHRQTIHNFVLTADAVLIFDQEGSGRQQRIPLASLDLAATQQAAQQAGLDFTPPA